MYSLKKFFLFCSGIDQTILEQCPSDENKYLGIGATIFFTGVLAFFAAAYALYTVFDRIWMAIPFGIIWGLMIFNLDRYIVSSMKSKGAFGRDFLVAFPRLILAILLALVISKPLELKIFEKEIDAELIIMEQEVFKSQEDKIKIRFESEIANTKTEIVTLKEEIAAKTKLRDELSQVAIQEADGTGGSMKKNLGPIYLAKKAEADEAEQELNDLLQINLPLISQKENAIQNLNSQIQSEITSLDRGKYGGLAARIDALDRLAQQSAAIAWANIFIILLFIAIETAPIFVKLIAYRSPYDFLLDEQEQTFEMAHKEHTSLLSSKIKNKIDYETSLGLHRTKAKIEVEKAAIDEEVKRRLEKIKTNASVQV